MFGRNHLDISVLMFTILSEFDSSFKLRSVSTHYRHTLPSFTMKNAGTQTLNKTFEKASELFIHPHKIVIPRYNYYSLCSLVY
jgi:hypothetical protein